MSASSAARWLPSAGGSTLVSAIPASIATGLTPSAAAISSWRRLARDGGAAYRSDDAFTGRWLLLFGPAGRLAHLWLQPAVFPS
jgi:hypothetical protein